MYDIRHFGLQDMVEVSAALRRIGAGAASMGYAAHRIVQYLYDHFVDRNTGEKSLVLARFFKTHPYEELDPELRAFARDMLGAPPQSPAMKCLTLLASAGALPEWNYRKSSARHQATSLPSEYYFLLPFNVRAVLGCGGMLPSGNLLAIIIFPKVHFPRETADLFKTVALSVKIAVLPFDGKVILA
jgi:two-component system, NtrC family, sensor kinase